MAQAEIVGEILHTVTDAFAEGHTMRNEKGELIMIQNYNLQDGGKHGGPDETPPAVAPGTTSATQAATKIIELWKSGATWNDVKDYLNKDVYNISEENKKKPTGTDPRYEKDPFALPSWMESPKNGWVPVH
ncbi:hypothetical protein EHQ52_17140 [Leptospira koniambonensis]|uniref:Uncharacterized protein n=1 Tax=Leptospira koniambonensis TaxID=2484950 RepID=A0A4R9J3W0_9LEPT|nr:hypothetical protein [Leptospira koniambonensis]TGL30061.1 hypothetical protein EHQ52_17140 [Leptospira koniambonensis]